VLILSGRHSQEQLQQIRQRIQELRDAAQSKKNPE
jgi:exonuclease VII small subunit